MCTELQQSPFLCSGPQSCHQSLEDFSYCFPEAKPAGRCIIWSLFHFCTQEVHFHSTGVPGKFKCNNKSSTYTLRILWPLA
jgi:hypothetical protein